MKIYVSFQQHDLERALAIAPQIAQHTDLIAAGSLMLHAHGANALRQLRTSLPDTPLLADAKIIERGKETVELFSKAGARWITVMAGINNDAIHATCNAASENNTFVLLDLSDTGSKGQIALEAKSLGVSALLFNEPYYQESASEFRNKWEMVRGNTDLPVIISARITRENLPILLELKPDGILLDRVITQASDPVSELQWFREQCDAA